MNRQTELEKLISKQLLEMRVSIGLSQREMGKMINMSNATISRIESGKQGLSIGQAEKIAKICGIDLLLWLQERY